MVLKLVAERLVRAPHGATHLGVRQRPGTSEPGADPAGRRRAGERPELPVGARHPRAAVASVVADDIPVAWSWLPHLLVVLVMVGRVYVGAHNPLDVTAGLGAGLLVGGVLDLLLR